MKNTVTIIIRSLVIAMIICFSYRSNGQTQWTPDNDPHWHIVWEDQFDTLNPQRWYTANNFDHYGEPQVFLKNNVAIEDGKLNFTLKYEKFHADSNLLDSFHCFHQLKYGIDYDYTSGWVETTQNYNVGINSYVEAKIKFPFGKSYWPAFWMFRGEGESESLTDYNEIDICEVVGYLGRDTVTINTHHPTTGPFYISFDQIGINYNYNDSFMIYGVKWLHDSLFFYIDGHLALAIENIGQMTPKRIVLGVGLKMDSNGVVLVPGDSSRCPDTMQVDYVRVFDYTSDTTYATTNKIKEPYIINPIGTKYSNQKQIQIRWQLNDSIYNLSNGFCHLDQWTYIGNGSPGYSTKSIFQSSSDHLYNSYTGQLSGYRFYYRVVVEGIDSAHQPFPEIHSVVMPPYDTATSTKFYAYGDTRGNSVGGSPPNHDSVCRQILKEIKKDPASQTLLLNAGDWNVSDLEQSWQGEFFNRADRNVRELMSSIPIMGAKGNHEVYSDAHGKIYNGQNYKKYFPFPYNCNNYTGNNFTYSFVNGPVLFIVLNIDTSGYQISFQQYSWLQAKLANTNKKWKVIMFHVPFKTLHGGLAGANTINFIKPLLQQYGVQLVISGHEHYYAHWMEQGTHYLTLGGGGAFIEKVLHSQLVSQDEIFVATIPHFAKFNVHNDVMSVDIIQGINNNISLNPADSSGSYLERFSIASKYEIDNTTIWDNDSLHPIYAKKISIKNGGLLHIQSTVNIIGNGFIEVEKGGHLILEGDTALVSNYKRAPEYLFVEKGGVDYSDYYYSEDTVLWRGIIVKGDQNYVQTDATKQGVLEIKNGATIENAEVAVYVGEYFVNNGNGVVTNNHGGGIIKIDGAHFLNNQKDIVMKPYELWSTTTQKPIPQQSYIVASDFKNDTNMLQDSLLNNGKQGNIYTQSIKGLRIQGNTFENLDNTLSEEERGTAITAINSSLNITPYYDPLITPPSLIAKNKFKNLYKGVEVDNGLYSNDLVKINKCVFTNTYRSIFVSGTNNLEILQDSISVPNLAPTQSGQPTPPRPYGIYINGGKGFRVEENSLYRPSSYGAAAFNGARGIIVENTGQNANQIRKNDFSNLFLGIQSQYENSGIDNNYNNVGLVLLCNNSQTSNYDFVALGKAAAANDPNSNYGRIGFALNQQLSVLDPLGGPSIVYPAGNDFSTVSGRTGDYQFDNDDANAVIYSYDNTANASPNAKPTLISSNVATYPISRSNPCQSNIGGNGTSNTTLYANLANAQLSLNSSKVILNIWQDGGNANLDQQVATTQPWDVYQQFNALIAESPYLSDDVLLETVNNPAFTSLMVKLVMVANPQAAKSDEIMQAIEDRIPAMPQSYIDEIKAGESAISQLEILKGNVASDNHLLRMTGEEIKRNYRNNHVDTWATDSLIAFVSRQNDLSDKFELATIYFNLGQYSNMESVFTDIANMNLNDIQNADYTNFVSIMNIAKTAKQAGLLEDFLSETEVANLETILNAKRANVSSLALAILKQNNVDYEFEEEVLDMVQSSARRAPVSNTESMKETTNDYRIYPNPCKDYITLAYSPSGDGESVYTISNADGKEVIQSVLSNTGFNDKIEVLIDLRELSPGVYYFNLINNGKSLNPQKLVIIK